MVYPQHREFPHMCAMLSSCILFQAPPFKKNLIFIYVCVSLSPQSFDTPPSLPSPATEIYIFVIQLDFGGNSLKQNILGLCPLPFFIVCNFQSPKIVKRNLFQLKQNKIVTQNVGLYQLKVIFLPGNRSALICK